MQAIKAFFQSFYSVAPYRKAMGGHVSFLVLYLIQQVFIALIGVIVAVVVIGQIRHHYLGPIIDNMPVIKVEDGKASSKAKMPVILKGNTGPIADALLQGPDGETFFDIYIDTTRSVKSFADPKNKKRLDPKYSNYTTIMAKDGFVSESSCGKKKLEKTSYYKLQGGDFRVDKYMFVFVTMYAYFIAVFGIPTVTLFAFPFLALIFAWKMVVLSIGAAMFVSYVVQRKMTFSSVSSFALMLFVPSVIIFGLLSLFFYVPVILFYIIIAVLIAIQMILQEAKEKSSQGVTE